jgi:hypothetical protein
MVRSCRRIVSDLWLGDRVHDVGDVMCAIVVLGSFIVIIGNEKKKGLKRMNGGRRMSSEFVRYCIGPFPSDHDVVPD